MKCPHCGAKHQEDGFKCTQCGTMIRVDQADKPKSIIGGAIIITIFCVVALVMIFMNVSRTGFFAEDQKTFNEYSWEEITNLSSDMVMSGNHEAAINEAKTRGFTTDDGSLAGDLVKEFELSDGTKLEAQLIDVYHDTRSNNKGYTGMTFIINVPVSKLPMNGDATNQGGWSASSLRQWANGEFFDSLPQDLKIQIKEVRKLTNNTGATESADAVTVSDDKIFALSYVELMGEQQGNVGYAEVLNAEGSQYMLLGDPAFKQELLKKIAEADKSLNWWLRSPNPETTNQFYSQSSGYDTEQDDPESLMANSQLSVIVAFCL